MTDFIDLGLSNQFTSKSGQRGINFRNGDGKRDNVTCIEVRQLVGSKDDAVRFDAKPEDNVAMAVAVLGVGRVTDSVESRAGNIAAGMHTSDDDLIESALVRLRAVMIRREAKTAKEKALAGDAFALYKLAYPENAMELPDFEGTPTCGIWTTKLRMLRGEAVL